MDTNKKQIISLDGDIVSLRTLKRRLGDYKKWGHKKVIADTYNDRICDRDGGLTQEELEYLIPSKG